MLGHEENDLKGYDNFGLFVQAVEAAGLTSVLKGPGPFTVFAPTDSAMQSFRGELSADVLKYHVVEGKHPAGSISSDLKTVNGQSLKYERKFRKTFIDDAIVGQADNFGGGSAYPVDVECDNGMIHAISIVLTPDYKAAGAEAGLGGRQS